MPQTDNDHRPALVWFRNDLRVHDNPALHAACETGRPVVALYILDEESKGPRAPGSASLWWLHGSLKTLQANLEGLNIPLVLRRGPSQRIVAEVAGEIDAAEIHWNRRYDGGGIELDKALRSALKDDGRTVTSWNGNLLVEPFEVKTGSDGWYKVFTPFWKAARETIGTPRQPYPKPKATSGFKNPLESENLDGWGLLPTKPDWAGGMRETWTPGENGARQRLQTFVDEALTRYRDHRDEPGEEVTSRLSPHLAFGEISPVTIWHVASSSDNPASDSSVQKFLSEVGWREFSYNLLFHFPDLGRRNFQEKFDAFPWVSDDAALTAWKKGQTGYPIVDAGMRQLWQTGWMHNRVRMVVASFLVKHLLIDWREGEAWFWDTLVDADPANNTASWQWVAGSGADAAPYFRIFNPILQGEKFDGDGHYVRRYVPEIAGLPDKYLHKPWTAPTSVLKDACITLGKDYPKPIVDHDKARKRALAALEKTKQ
ncbi:Deoxyribodipyrimidine photo-lyase [Hartmannibacter diazotrophicus]|uniref:Deoxyribodipyrimidine photo-lyase n=1 Tax=Hartmannibacter diazotrophicus TaxID=1482074 RepID=A0A2C9D486_9HYPH|nr:deoxyribodipyrimidine photo-lyase [Hartmannibacter diazotrophicus]SON55104.1 Deoxyribodipyrimidine photo-lyase [Hartmannibacter diazotrophicus]